MSSTYASRRDRNVADDYLANHLPCRKCGAATDRETLGNLGGQCSPCYDAYCAETVPEWLLKRKPLSQDDRKQLAKRVRAGMAKMLKAKANDNPRAWAYRLKGREEGGEKLTPPQAAAWRHALRFEGEPADEVLA